MTISMSEMSKEQLQKEINKGLEDLKNGNVHKFEDFKKVLLCIAEGDIFLQSGDKEKAEESYRKATTITDDKQLASKGFYKLGLLYYDFQTPEILYSKIYFELALEYGQTDASYYLATIYEWEKETGRFEFNSGRIEDLYQLASEKATDEKVKKLATEKIKK